MPGLEDILHGDKAECLLDIVVTPGAKKDEVIGIDIWRKRLEVRVKEKAVENRANRAVVKLLEGFFEMPHGSAVIVRGVKGTKKTVRLGLNMGEAEEFLIRHIGAKDEVGQR